MVVTLGRVPIISNSRIMPASLRESTCRAPFVRKSFLAVVELDKVSQVKSRQTAVMEHAFHQSRLLTHINVSYITAYYLLNDRVCTQSA
jgi:hypothetical protein